MGGATNALEHRLNFGKTSRSAEITSAKSTP